MKRFRSDCGGLAIGTVPYLVLIEFRSLDAARLFDDVPGYRQILPLRQKSADGTVVIVEAV